MYRRTSGRRWRRRDVRGVPYEPAEPVQPPPGEAGASLAEEARETCAVCGEPRPGDEQVLAGLPCQYCQD